METRSSVRGSVLLAANLATAASAPVGHSSGGSRASIRSGRYSQSSSHRGSVAARAAGGTRGTRGGTALDSSGLPFERIVVIDPEDGRDRTPKPLVAAHPHGGAQLDEAWGSSDAGGAADSTGRASSMSYGPALPGIPSARSFPASEVGDAALDGGASQDSLHPAPPGLRSGRQSMLHQAAAGSMAAGGGGAPRVTAAGDGTQRATLSGGRATPLAADLLDLDKPSAQPTEQPEQPRQPGQQARRRHVRSQAVQCAPAPHTSRGVQVLPWELRASSAAEDAAAEASGAAGAPGQAAGAADAAADGDGLEDEEALAAMAQQQSAADLRGGGFESHRSSPLGSHRGVHSLSPSRRGSTAGASTRMSARQDSEYDPSRPPSVSSRRTTMSTATDQWGSADRDSLGSGRTSFAAFMADGRASFMSSVGGFHPTHQPSSGGRASVVSMSRRGSAMPQQVQAAAPAAAPAPRALSPAEALARQQRRQRAEQERALARLPGLLLKLQAAERAVLLSAQHAKLAQYHGVPLCHAEAEDNAGGQDHTAAEGAAAHLLPHQEAVGHAHPEGTNSSPFASPAAQSAGPEGSATQPPAAAHSGSASQLGSGRQQPELPLLWEWRSEQSGELPVSCLAFNRAAPGLVAVGYGRLEYGVEGAGLVAVWSLANPSHPVWHAATPCGVSALDWSSKAPSCLAAGFFDGSLALYDVRSTSGSQARPLARAPPAGPSGGGHAEPVWRLCHVPKASDPGEEMLVSASSDGRVLQWAHAQGLEASELLALRRAQLSGAAGQQRGKAAVQRGSTPPASEGYLGRAAGATCFAFNPADPRTYLVGTEEGVVHRCSTAFSEQGGQVYAGHVAPVYQVCWSPFSPSHFITASADWSVRLWDETQPRRPLATLALPGARAEVADAAFCPAAATLLAAAAGNSLQLWDVERSVLAPRLVATRLGRRFTALAFSQAAPVIVAGADDGAVGVYSLAGLYDAAAAAEAAEAEDGSAERWREEQRQRLEAALRLHTAHHTME